MKKIDTTWKQFGKDMVFERDFYIPKAIEDNTEDKGNDTSTFSKRRERTGRRRRHELYVYSTYQIIECFFSPFSRR